MEKYIMFMDWKNQYSENEYTTESNLEKKKKKDKNDVAPPSSQDEALSRYSVSGEVPR